MRTLIFVLTVMSFGFAQTPPIEPGVSHELAKWRAARYSDVRYKLNLTLEKMSPVLKGTIEIRVNVRDAATEKSSPPSEGGVDAALGGRGGSLIVLDWRKIKGYEDRSTVSNVQVNNTTVYPGPPDGFIRRENETFYDEVAEHLIFRDGVVAGENVIKLDFTSPILTSGSAITRYVDKEDGAEYIYSLFVPSDASTAFPVFDQPDLKARFDLDVFTPTDWTLVTNAAITKERLMSVNISTRTPQPAEILANSFDAAETKPISTYVFAFAAGPWQQVSAPSASAAGSRESEPGAVATGSHDLGLRNADLGIRRGASVNPRSEIRSPQAGDPVATAPGSDIRHNVFVRRSQLAKFQPHAADVFRLNREGIKFLEAYFDYKFPFPKYDLVLIPELPFGGMEHAGATFLREDRVIFPQEPTKNDYITRANLIFHEAAHQWFGDTVTMRWFDDLWLKEGFAEFMAYKTLEKVMPEYNAWKVFYERNKQAAYLTDSTRGTTPIYQEIKNLSAAKSAYGNIVYRKAPSFLKQAEFYIGADKFQTAVRSFLEKYEFGNAVWEDLVREFENVRVAEIKTTEFYATLSARDKSELEKHSRWSIGADWVKFWVAGRGMPIYRISPNVVEDDGLFLGGGATGGHTIVMKDFSQNGTLENLNWLQNIRVLKAYDNGEREESIAELGSRRYATLPDEEAKGLRKGEFTFNGPYSGSEEKTRKPVFVFPNYQDYGYGIFLLDDKSRDYVLKNIHNEKDEFLRSMMWGSLWDSVREGELDPKDYVELVLKSLSTTRSSEAAASPPIQDGSPIRAPKDGRQYLREDETTVATLLNRVSTAMTYYLSEKHRDAIAPRLEAMLIEKMENAPTLGQRLTFYRAFLNVASTERARRVLKGMLRQESEPGAVATGSHRSIESTKGNPGAPGSDLPLKTKDRFDIVTRLLILNDPDAGKLLADLEKTETADEAKRYAYAARAGIPTKENKAKYWSEFTTNKQISESWIEAAFGPFNSVRHADLTLPYLERALKELPNHKRNRKIFFVNGWLGAFIGGQRGEVALAIVNGWLAENPDLDRDLRLKILENVDLIERAVKIRTTFPR
jgi:aminopeptidase N